MFTFCLAPVGYASTPLDGPSEPEVAQQPFVVAPAGPKPSIPEVAIRQLAEHDGISLNRAKEILEVQHRPGDLSGTVHYTLGDRYAGVWFDREHVRWRVGVADGESQAAVHELLDLRDLNDIVDVVEVPSTFKQLESARDGFIAAHPELDDRGEGVGLDASRNAIVVVVSDAKPETTLAEYDRLADASKNGAGVRLVIDRRPHDQLVKVGTGVTYCNWSTKSCDAPFRTGTAIFQDNDRYNPGSCTSGFTVRGNSAGYIYLLTAGHCLRGYPDGAQWDARQKSGQPRKIGNQRPGWHDGTYDAGLIKYDSPYFQSWYLGAVVWYTDGGYNETHALYGDWLPTSGAWLCHVGITSSAQCGTNTIVRAAIWLPNGNGVVTLHQDYNENTACSSGGDSGGPWLYYYFAAGIKVDSTGRRNALIEGGCDGQACGLDEGVDGSVADEVAGQAVAAA